MNLQLKTNYLREQTSKDGILTTYAKFKQDAKNQLRTEGDVKYITETEDERLISIHGSDMQSEYSIF
jgi:hypothetical protein